MRAPELPERQKAIRAKCFHPSGTFSEFSREEIEQSIPRRFEEIARRNPNRLAVKTRKQALDYAQLNNAANIVARAVLDRSSEAAEPVALLLENDMPMIAAILGALKAGKSYVPLDVSYPRATIAYILENSAARVVVTNTANLPLARELACGRARFVNLDGRDAGTSAPNLDLNIAPDLPAYILYTSGSTGKPKGVVQTHRNVLHEIRNYTNAIHISPEDRLVLVSSPTFADAVRTTYAALLNGAGLYPLNIREEGVAHLADWMDEQEITIYRSVPAVFRQLAASLTGNEKLSDVRLIYAAGDTVSKNDIALYKKHFPPGCIFLNGLGSGESLTFRWYFIDKETDLAQDTVPVGYAIDDKELFLLDEDGKEVECNQVGEMMVRSRYLSPGYWLKPELTNAVFSAAARGESERIYRTGDLGRRAADGLVEHLGRKDFQVKIRGHRIEAGQIEMALLDLGTITEAAVIARAEGGEEQRLIAYVVPRRRPGPAVSALRRALKHRLPEYMIPAAFVLLDAMPLTANGKVDRGVLPAPDRSRPDLESPFVAPRSAIEETLANIWAPILTLDRVGIHDDFFDLGGHSILATQVISRMREIFRAEISLRSFFDAPTVAELARAIETAMNHSSPISPKISRVPRSPRKKPAL